MSTTFPLPAVSLEDDLDVAPLDLSDFTPEQQAEIQESLASRLVGRARTVARDEVLRALDEMHHRVD